MKKDDNIDRVYYKRDRLNQVRGFCAMVQNDCSSLKASKKIGLEPGTIRQQVRTLEEQLNINLFDRTPNNRMILTEAGMSFYEKVIPLIQNFDGLLKNFTDEFKKDTSREIKIAGHSIVLSDILPKYLKILLDKEEFANTKIKLINIPRDEALDRLRSNKIDIAFYPTIYGEQFSSEFMVERLFRYNHVMVLPKNHPLANKDAIEKEDFQKYPFFVMDNFTFYNPNNILKFGKSNISFENAGWEIFLGLIKEGIGITGLTEKVLNRYKGSSRLFVTKDIDKYFPLMYYSVLTRSNFINKKAINILMAIMRLEKEE